MAKTERLYVRIEPEIKSEATKLFDGLGITVSDAVTLFIQRSLDSGGLPFHVDTGKLDKQTSSSQLK